MKPDKTVMQVHAPPPRPTIYAALLLASGLSMLFLIGLWINRALLPLI